MGENKAKICEELFKLLKITRGGQEIQAIDYRLDRYGETVTLQYGKFQRKEIDVTADSGVQMIRDIMARV